MHIAFLSSSAELGGAERVLLDIMRGIQRARLDWRLSLLSPGDGLLARRARENGLHVESVPFPRELALAGGYGGDWLSCSRAAIPAARYVWALRGALDRLGPDIVHSNGLKTHLAASWCRPGSSRLVWHLHEYVSRRARPAALLRKSAWGRPTVVANSASVATDARRVLPTGLDIRTIPNGVDLEAFSPRGAAADLDALSGLTPPANGTLRVGLVATYAKWKGHATFLEAVSRLQGQTAVRAYLVGGPIYATQGSQLTKLEVGKLIDVHGLHGRVGLVDFVEHTADVMRSLDIVVHASTEPEPFGLVIAEAMACERAVIAANGGGAAELIEEGTDGLTHQPGNVAQLANAIDRLVDDKQLRCSLAIRARDSACRRWDNRRVVDAFGALYMSLVHEAMRSSTEELVR